MIDDQRILNEVFARGRLTAKQLAEVTGERPFVAGIALARLARQGALKELRKGSGGHRVYVVRGIAC